MSGGGDRPAGSATAVLDVRGLQWATEQDVVAAVLGRRPGVRKVEVNPVAQAATVVFDPARTSVADVRRWVTECGYHCAGQSVPGHICDPLAEPRPAGPERAAAPAAPQEVMGHGGHGEMSMASMVADMRNRFLVAVVFSVLVLIWSPIGRDVLGLDLPRASCARCRGRSAGRWAHPAGRSA